VKTVVLLALLTLCACAQITGVQSKDHRTLARCAGTFRAIGQLTTTAQPEFTETSQFMKQATVFRVGLRAVQQSLSQIEQDNLTALESRAFEQGLASWNGETGQNADDLTAFNRLEFHRIERRCEAVLNG
jgi:hypothetical protein